LKHGVYKTYIRPHLEFRIQARSPHFSKDIDVLERVQKAVTNLVLKLRKYSYQERLKEATENAGVAKMQGGGGNRGSGKHGTDCRGGKCGSNEYGKPKFPLCDIDTSGLQQPIELM